MYFLVGTETNMNTVCESRCSFFLPVTTLYKVLHKNLCNVQI